MVTKVQLYMIVWTPAVLGVLYACVLYFCTCTYSAQLSTFHMERHSGKTIIICKFDTDAMVKKGTSLILMQW